MRGMLNGLLSSVALWALPLAAVLAPRALAVGGCVVALAVVGWFLARQVREERQ